MDLSGDFSCWRLDHSTRTPTEIVWSGKANGTGTLMSSDRNSFPPVCLVKKRQRLRGMELTTLRGLEMFASCFLFSHPPSCSCYSILPPSTSCHGERDTHTEWQREREGEREKEWEGMVGTRWGSKQPLNTCCLVRGKGAYRRWGEKSEIGG